MSGAPPRTGARFLLERRAVSDDGERATYCAVIYTRQRRFEHSARIALDGGVEITDGESTGGAELQRRLTAIARQLARAARQRAEAGLPAWPERILRWRDVEG
jgi:hypothetical protein